MTTTPPCPAPEPPAGDAGAGLASGGQKGAAARAEPAAGRRAAAAAGDSGAGASRRVGPDTGLGLSAPAHQAGPSRSTPAHLERVRRRRGQRLGRWLWQGLALLVVAHNLAVIATTQFAPERLLSAVLVWFGALLCLEHRLPRLRPRPDWTGLILGSLLLLACLLRSNQLLVRDGLIFLLAPLQGVALALVCLPRRQLGRLWESLLVLALLPLSLPLQAALPERALSWLTARLAQGWLLLAGQPALVEGQRVLLGANGVAVAGGCSGAMQLLQVGIVTLILLLAFPLQRWRHRLVMLLLPPLLALLCNGARVALLAWLTLLPPAPQRFWFAFSHEDAGSLLIGGVAMTLTVLLHLALVERELRPLEAELGGL